MTYDPASEYTLEEMRDMREEAELALHEEPRAKAFGEAEDVANLLDNAHGSTAFDADEMHAIHMRLRSLASDLRMVLAGAGT